MAPTAQSKLRRKAQNKCQNFPSPYKIYKTNHNCAALPLENSILTERKEVKFAVKQVFCNVFYICVK